MIGIPADDTANSVTIRTSISSGLVTCPARYTIARIVAAINGGVALTM